MPKNEFKAFAISENSNVLKQSEYEFLPALESGFQSGIARSEELNKVWRQASTIASVIASFMANKSGEDVLDDGDLNKLQSTLLEALLNNSTSQLDKRYLNTEFNLKDLTDTGIARDNLGLGKLSVKDQVTSQEIFNDQAVYIGESADLNNYTTPGLYYQPSIAQAQTGKNYPEETAGSLEIYKHAGVTQIFRVYAHSRSYIRSFYVDSWSPWVMQYDGANPPTAEATGAVPVTGGNVGYLDGAQYYAIKTDGWQGAGSWGQQLTDGTAPFFKRYSYAQDVNSTYNPIVKGSIQTIGVGYAAAVSFGILTKGGASFPDACIHSINDGGQSHVWSFGSDGEFRSPSTVRAGGAALGTNGDVLGTLWGGWLSTWLGANTTTQAYVNQRIQDVQNWTSQNFISSMDLTAPVEVQFVGGFGYPRGTDGAHIYNLNMVGGDSNQGVLVFRYQRFYRNGWIVLN